MERKFFGTDGIRGTVGTHPLTPDFALQLANAVGRVLKQSSSQQPAINFPIGKSSTWQNLYAASAAGQFIPVPYHDVKVTDPEKLGFAAAQYR